MININTDDEAEHLGLHTHFMKFKDDKKWIAEQWKNKIDTDTCWVPWDWATTDYKHKSKYAKLYGAEYYYEIKLAGIGIRLTCWDTYKNDVCFTWVNLECDK